MSSSDSEAFERIESIRRSKINTGITMLIAGSGILGAGLALGMYKTITLALGLPILIGSLCWLLLSERTYRKEKEELKKKIKESERSVYEDRGILKF